MFKRRQLGLQHYNPLKREFTTNRTFSFRYLVPLKIKEISCSTFLAKKLCPDERK